MTPDARAPLKAGRPEGRGNDSITPSMQRRGVDSKAGDALAAALAEPVAELVSRPRYYTRGTAPIERRAWDRAVREIQSFRPGRELLVLADDLHAWIERQPAHTEAKPAENGEALPYSAFQRTARRGHP